MANVSVSTYSFYDSASSFNVILAILYSLIVVIGLVGNCFVITIVGKTRSMITPTNILLVNVAFADIISLIWCPIPLAINLSGKHVSERAADLICKFFTARLRCHLCDCFSYLSKFGGVSVGALLCNC